MSMRFLRYFLFLMIPLLIGLGACRSQGGASKAMKRIDERKAEKAKETREKYDAAIKRHNDIQSKETRKRMKQLKKKSRKHNDTFLGK